MSRIDKATGGPRRAIRSAALGVLLSLSLWVVGSGSVLISQEELKNKSVVNYNLIYAERGDFVRKGTGSAEVYYLDNIQLRFKNHGARLREILVRKEAVVSEGEALAVFEIERSQADLTQLRIAYQRAVEADAKKKQNWRDEQEEMQQAIQEEADPYEREKLRLAQARLELENEQSQHAYEYEQKNRMSAIEEMEEDLNDNRLLAPFDAVVRSVSIINAGDSVTENDRIVSLYSKDKFLLKVDNSNNQIRYNMTIAIQSGNRNDPKYYTGVVVAADNVLPEKLRSGSAYIAIDQHDEIDPEELRFVSIEYDMIRLENVVTIKRKALTMERGAQYLTLLEGDTVKKRFMNVGMHNNDMQWIIQGLEDEQAVIVN